MDSPSPWVCEEYRRLDAGNQLPGREIIDYTDSITLFQYQDK